MSWEKVRLGELCKMNSGGTPRRGNPKFYGGDIPWAKIGDIESAKQGIIYGTEESITDEGLKSIGGRIFPKGSLLLAMYGSVGKVAFAGTELSTNQAILGIRIHDTKILNYSYLKYWFETIKQQLLNRAVGVALQNISLGIVKDLQIPLPPLHIQKQIANILDKADALRKKDQELLQKYDELAQSIFIDMFGDPVKNEKGWEEISLGEAFKHGVKCGPFGSALKKNEYAASGIPVWTMDNIVEFNFKEHGCLFINQEKYSELKSYKVSNGDIIISRAGTVGKMCVVNSNHSDSIISTNLIRLSLDENKLLPDYFVFLMKYFSNKIGRLKKGNDGAFTHMNTGILTNLKILLPPIELQYQFKSVYNFTNFSKSLLSNSPESLFQSLLQKAFTGELIQD